MQEEIAVVDNLLIKNYLVRRYNPGNKLKYTMYQINVEQNLKL